jgi:hypothetical protein
MAATSGVTGGTKLQAKLSSMAQQLGNGATVSVGFLAGATYPAKARGILDSGKRLSKRNRKVLRKLADKDAASMPNVPTVALWNEMGTSKQPPRPYFRRMIAAKSPRWAEAMAAAAKHENYNVQKTLAAMGDLIQGQLRRSIATLTDPPLSPITIARKGFPKPLIDSGVMLNSVDYEVKQGAAA